MNAVIFFADSFTWPEALRSFMQAEAELYAEPLELMTSLAPEYPMAPSDKLVESRVKILSFLVDQVNISIYILKADCSFSRVSNADSVEESCCLLILNILITFNIF